MSSQERYGIPGASGQHRPTMRDRDLKLAGIANEYGNPDIADYLLERAEREGRDTILVPRRGLREFSPVRLGARVMRALRN